MSNLSIQPLTPDRWPDFIRLFGNGVGGGCWCMYWRAPTRKQYLERKGEANKRSMRRLVQTGHVPGLLAYWGDEPIGWCAVAPREAYPGLERSPSRKAIDREPVWSITCVYVARSHRRHGFSIRLIEAAVDYVRSKGGRIVEGYPVPQKAGTTSTNYAFTGFVSAFQAAGFVEVRRRFETRPILRYEIERHTPIHRDPHLNRNRSRMIPGVDRDED